MWRPRRWLVLPLALLAAGCELGRMRVYRVPRWQGELPRAVALAPAAVTESIEVPAAGSLAGADANLAHLFAGDPRIRLLAGPIAGADRAETCRLAAARGATEVVLPELSWSVRRGAACVEYEGRAIFMEEILEALSGHELGERACLRYRPTDRVDVELSARLRVVDAVGCADSLELAAHAHEQGRWSSPPSVARAAWRAKRELVGQLRRALTRELAGQAVVAAAAGGRAEMASGRAAGVRPGQTWSVRRGDDEVAVAIVTAAGPGSATLEVYDGPGELRAGDRLVQTDRPYRILIAPTALATAAGLGAGGRVGWYRPRTGLRLTFTVEGIPNGAGDAIGLGALEAGWQWVVVPARLALYGTLGLGAAGTGEGPDAPLAAIAPLAAGVKVDLGAAFLSVEGGWLLSAGSLDLSGPLLRAGAGLKF